MIIVNDRHSITEFNFVPASCCSVPNCYLTQRFVNVAINKEEFNGTFCVHPRNAWLQGFYYWIFVCLCHVPAATKSVYSVIKSDMKTSSSIMIKFDRTHHFRNKNKTALNSYFKSKTENTQKCSYCTKCISTTENNQESLTGHIMVKMLLFFFIFTFP